MLRVFVPIVVLVTTTAGAADVAPSPSTLLQRVDTLRAPDEANVVQKITLQSQSKGRPDSPAHFEVRTRKGVGTVVLALDGDARGQKYLSTEAGYWFYAPRTRQAIRLTPSQLLRGQASVGDISRVQFSTDYSASFATPPIEKLDGKSAWVLNLVARSPLATYARVTLYVDRATNQPLQADLYAAAGRKLKTVQFGPATKVDGKQVIKSTVYTDAIDGSKKTSVTIDSINNKETPAAMFRPQSLSIQ